MQCFFCQAEVKDGSHSHVHACARRNGCTDSKAEVRYKQLCFKHGRSFDFQLIRQHYLDDEWSLPDFREKLGLAFTETGFLLEFYGIPKRSISKSKVTRRYKEKFEATCLERFGCSNPSSQEDVKLRRVETVQLRYGADNVRKSTWFKQHYAETMQERYGVGALPNRYGRMQEYWDCRTKEEKQAHMRAANIAYKAWYEGLTPEQREAYNQSKARLMHIAGSSKLEAQVAAALQKLKLNFMPQCWIRRRSYDFLLNGTNILLEVQGDYWHANPAIYSPDALVRYPDRTIAASVRRAEDMEKHAHANSYGFQVLELWESDIKRHSADLPAWLLSRIASYFNSPGGCFERRRLLGESLFDNNLASDSHGQPIEKNLLAG